MMYQVGVFYNKVLNEEEKFRLCDNIASHLCNAQPFIQVSSARVPNSLRGCLQMTSHFLGSLTPRDG